MTLFSFISVDDLLFMYRVQNVMFHDIIIQILQIILNNIFQILKKFKFIKVLNSFQMFAYFFLFFK